MIDDHDPVGELVGLIEVLGRQQQRDAVGDELTDHAPHPHPARRVKPRGRLVEEQHRWPRHESGGEIEAPAHPPGVALQHAVGGIGEVEALEQLPRSRLRFGASQSTQAPDHHEVLAAAEDLIERRVLRGDADVALHARRVMDDVKAGDPRRAAIWQRQCREDPNRRRLASTVRAEHPEDRRQPGPRGRARRARRSSRTASSGLQLRSSTRSPHQLLTCRPARNLHGSVFSSRPSSKLRSWPKPSDPPG